MESEGGFVSRYAVRRVNRAGAPGPAVRWQVRKRRASASSVSHGSFLFHTSKGSCYPPEGICSRR